MWSWECHLDQRVIHQPIGQRRADQLRVLAFQGSCLLHQFGLGLAAIELHTVDS